MTLEAVPSETPAAVATSLSVLVGFFRESKARRRPDSETFQNIRKHRVTEQVSVFTEPGCAAYIEMSCRSLTTGGPILKSEKRTESPPRSGVQHIGPTCQCASAPLAAKGARRISVQLRSSALHCT